MKKHNAFTLIEVMVVLSVLAIIAILAYNFFGGTMKEASEKQALTKIYRDLTMLMDASELYYTQNGTWANSLTDLVNAGTLKAVPEPPNKAAYWTGVGAYWYWSDTPYDDMDGDGDSDDYTITLNRITDELCELFNGAYATDLGIGATRWDYTAQGGYPEEVLGLGHKTYCIDWNATADSGNEIVMVWDTQP